ncbi:MAG: hypothetical protein ISR83_07545 [Candidatus Marinimicrobia bacterium]|nr:hypothetical protein [Candidatus Neomarinimicrobiota bacterium]
MTLIPTKRFSGLAAIYGSVIYFIMSHISILFYAGGTPWDKTKSGYHYWENFLSDLGETVAKNGEPNLSSMILMNSSIIIFGLSLIIFYLNYSSFTNIKWIGLMAAGFGIFSSIGLIMVGGAPSNTLKAIHLFGVYMWALGLLIAIILTLCSNNHIMPKWLTVFSSILMALLAYHMYQGITNVRGLPITIVQKIVFNLNVFWYMAMGWVLTNEKSLSLD